MTKPVLTGTSHTLPFEKLSPLDFERLCLWLVTREGFERVEYLGESGGEQGRDVVAWKDGQRFVFQCKRVQSFGPADACKEIKKLRRLPQDAQPHELVFVVSRAVSADARQAIREAWGDEASCHFWAGSELDERVRRHQDLLVHFFQLPPSGAPAPFRHNLPFSTLGPLFHGREEILARLRETLLRTLAGRAAAIAGKAIHGLGGVGKTRLAIEYAWQHAADYSAILFVGAGSPGDLRRNLADLCAPKILNLPEHAIPEEEIREAAVLRRLGEQPGWLLILDNVDSPESAEAVDELVPRLHGGHVLLTGRLAHWGAEVEAIELDLLTEEAATDFLLARTAGKRRSTPEDAAHATNLAYELGYLPLALEQAGAAIAIRGLTFSGYLKDWRTRHDQVLTWFDKRVSHYPVSFAVTWQTSVYRLTAPARRLLERLAWLGPEPIPEALLEVPVPDLPEAEQSLHPHDALVELVKYSLVTRASEAPTFTVHRLVQDVTRRSLRNDPRNGPLTEALAWVNAGFLGDAQDVRTWPVLSPLAPHVRALVAYSDAAEIAEPTARLMNQLGQLLQGKALHSEAEPLMRRALAIDEKSFGTNHPMVAVRLNNLAVLLQDTNRFDEAEPLMQRALTIDENSFGTDHPEVATDLNNLAQLLKTTNRLAEAEPLMRRALAIDENSFGTDHPNVARSLNNLAQLLQATNRLAEAEPLMRQVVAIFESSLGADHPKVATALNNLAALLQATKRLAEAEPLMRRALTIDENSFGTDHPNVARNLNNLAQLLQATNCLAEAEPLMRQVVAIFESSLGANHPNVAVALNNLAQLLKATNRLAEAEPLMRRALTIDENSFGTDHPNVARNLNNLAQIFQATNRLAEAEPLMRRALAIFLGFKRRTGHEHPNLQASLGNYALLLQAMGKTQSEINEVFSELAEKFGFNISMQVNGDSDEH